MAGYESWGRFPRATPSAVVPFRWRDAPPSLAGLPGPLLAYARGRSYGDSCLNDGGTLLDVNGLTRFIAFDAERGVLRAEAGVGFDTILNLIVPRGWFLPVTPGTKFVSVGGAIANDVHGKNHHRAGTFGCHVTHLELLRSDGTRHVCSPTVNAELFRATIGGLGLTGVILWAEIALKPIPGPQIELRTTRFGALEDFFTLSEAADADDEYTAGWIDGMSRGRSLGRGVFLSGNHARGDGTWRGAHPSRLRLPMDMPGWVLSPLSIRLFNDAYYLAQGRKAARGFAGYESFFYPLDVVHNWNRAYGKRGFLQYQCVVPFDDGLAVVREILDRIAASRSAYFVVGKVFGDVRSPGMLSFPRRGVTLAVDIPNRGPEIFALLDAIDALVIQAHGAVYPAKDARMSPGAFEAFFPQWRDFARHVDPAFSSGFWRRVTAGLGAAAGARRAEAGARLGAGSSEIAAGARSEAIAAGARDEAGAARPASERGASGERAPEARA